MDPTQKKILLDLAKDYREKLRRAAAHMHSMGESVDIPEEEIVSAIASVVMHFLVELIDLRTDMSAEDFAEASAEALQQRRDHVRRVKRERQS